MSKHTKTGKITQTHTGKTTQRKIQARDWARDLQQLELRSKMLTFNALCRELRGRPTAFGEYNAVAGPLFFVHADPTTSTGHCRCVVGICPVAIAIKGQADVTHDTPAFQRLVKRFVHWVLGKDTRSLTGLLHKRSSPFIFRIDPPSNPSVFKHWCPFGPPVGDAAVAWYLGERRLALSTERYTSFSQQQPQKLQRLWVLWKLLQTVTLADLLAWNHIAPA